MKIVVKSISLGFCTIISLWLLIADYVAYNCTGCNTDFPNILGELINDRDSRYFSFILFGLFLGPLFWLESLFTTYPFNKKQKNLFLVQGILGFISLIMVFFFMSVVFFNHIFLPPYYLILLYQFLFSSWSFLLGLSDKIKIHWLLIPFKKDTP